MSLLLAFPVKTFMSRPVHTISPRKNPAETAQLMGRHDIGRLPVVEDGQLVGIITRSDAMGHFYGLVPWIAILTRPAFGIKPVVANGLNQRFMLTVI
jgi:CBS-domain-containing membrane protein